jgi:hypothetical protein
MDLWRKEATSGWLFPWAFTGPCRGRTGLVPAPRKGCMAVVQVAVFRGKALNLMQSCSPVCGLGWCCFKEASAWVKVQARQALRGG